MFQPKNRDLYDKSVWNYLFGKDDCPFCLEISRNASHIIWKWNHWCILHNLYSYSGDNDHLMAVPFEHKKFSYELTSEEVWELSHIYAFMKEYYGEKQYFSATRETMSNRSIEHYHMHFIPGKLQGKWLRKMLELQGFPIEEDLKFE